MPKKIIVFADGTGNAFTAQQSNIWRLYEGLDQTRPDQIAHYIKGVGTSGFKPFAALDGATGIGVPSNVRRLYEFISWNWEKGDEIYMFGFSRGAFTIRTLVGLMHNEGLVPIQVGTNVVTRPEMRRNVMAAWRSYRSKTISKTPLIWLIWRFLAGILAFARRRLAGGLAYSEVTAQAATQKRVEVPIAFVGLFDTVEAYGVPLEEFRRAVDVAVWPISFRNKVLSKHVQCARHALSLDDERVTFHPLRIDLQNSEKPERIKEVWFSGVHSDVGGGYPEDDLAYVPLNWMTEQLGGRLRFINGMPETFAANASPYASAHDSRSGLAVFYRYGPRTVGMNGGAPVIHYSVAEKMAFGIERYAPVTLPDTAKVLMPDGSFHEICGFDDTKSVWRDIGDLKLSREMKTAEEAVMALSQPDAAVVSMTRDAIWWRRVAYFLLLFSVILVALLPWIVKPAVTRFRDAMVEVSEQSGTGWWGILASTDQGLSAIFKSLLLLVGHVLPGYTKPWTDAFVERPIACGIVVAVAVLLYAKNALLRDRIADLARQAWLPAEKTTATQEQKSKYKKPVPDTVAKIIRESKLAAFIECAVARYALPFAAVALIYVAAAVAISRTTVTVRDGLGGYCTETKAATYINPGQTLERDGFAIDKLCWASGLKLEKGQHYTLWIEMTDPFFDQTIMTDIAGFTDGSLRHRIAWPIRRWWSADWFQPIARIGASGSDAWPLISVDGDTAIEAGTDFRGKIIPKSFYADDSYKARLQELNAGPRKNDPSRLRVSEKIPSDEMAAARDIRAKYALRGVYASTFIAPIDGELFLYVNDAIAAVPFFTYAGFYRNNTGSATVTVQHLASPPPPPPPPRN